MATTTPESRRAAAKARIQKIDNRRASLQKQIDSYFVGLESTSPGSFPSEAWLKAEITRLDGVRSQLNVEKAEQQKIIDAANSEISLRNLSLGFAARAEAEANGYTPTPSPTGFQPNDPDDLPRVNLSGCRELYFKGNEKFIKDTLEVKGFTPSNGGGGGSFNSPSFASAFASYETANNLWKEGKATKGRIQTWVPPNNVVPNYLQSENDNTTGAVNRSFDKTRKIFQFHYNPGSVNMAYGGVQDVDVSMYTSGLEKFNMWNQARSTIAFELLLNRMPDMKYIDPKSKGYTKDGVNYPRDVYDRTPKNSELEMIYTMGTMYDVEFLLRVLLGYRLKSQLRGNKWTSDVGWITPRPVELHLGNSLRYLVNITSLNVNHVIFNERMVPLFSTVSITGSRIPDFDNSVSDGARPTTTTTTTTTTTNGINADGTIPASPTQ